MFCSVRVYRDLEKEKKREDLASREQLKCQMEVLTQHSPSCIRIPAALSLTGFYPSPEKKVPLDVHEMRHHLLKTYVPNDK